MLASVFSAYGIWLLHCSFCANKRMLKVALGAGWCGCINLSLVGLVSLKRSFTGHYLFAVASFVLLYLYLCLIMANQCGEEKSAFQQKWQVVIGVAISCLFTILGDIFIWKFGNVTLIWRVVNPLLELFSIFGLLLGMRCFFRDLTSTFNEDFT